MRPKAAHLVRLASTLAVVIYLVIGVASTAEAAPRQPLVTDRTASTAAPAGWFGSSCVVATSDNRRSMTSGSYQAKIKCTWGHPSATVSLQTSIQGILDGPWPVSRTWRFSEATGSCAINNPCGDGSATTGNCTVTAANRLDDGSIPGFFGFTLNMGGCSNSNVDWDRFYALLSGNTYVFNGMNIGFCGYASTTPSFNDWGTCEQTSWADFDTVAPRYHWAEQVGSVSPCDGLGVTWSPSELTQIPVGQRQSVTVTAPPETWGQVEFRLNWDWASDPLVDPSDWDTIIREAVYEEWGLPTITEAPNSTTRVFRTMQQTNARSNSNFGLRCRLIEEDPEYRLRPGDVFYRRLYGDTPDFEGPPENRACWFLRVTWVGSPLTPTWDTSRTVHFRVLENDEYDDTGGITDVEYAWRPDGGSRQVFDLDFSVGGPPWASSPFNATGVADVTAATGGSDGRQSVVCTDSEGTMVISIGAGGGTRVTPPEGGEAGTGTGGIGTYDPPPGGGSGGSGGDPPPGNGGGVGPGGVGTGPGTGETCFDVAGWSLFSPVSWVTGAIKVGGCYARALVIPSDESVQDFVADVREAAEGTFPLSMLPVAFDAVETFGDAASDGSASCVEVAPMPGDPGEDVCVEVPDVLTPSQSNTVKVLMMGSIVVALVWSSVRMVLA